MRIAIAHAPCVSMFLLATSQYIRVSNRCHTFSFTFLPEKDNRIIQFSFFTKKIKITKCQSSEHSCSCSTPYGSYFVIWYSTMIQNTCMQLILILIIDYIQVYQIPCTL